MKPSKIHCLFVLWISAVGVGVYAMHRYAWTPAATRTAPRTWPADPHLAGCPGQPSLVMFAHPQCPCTRISLDELSRVVSDCRGIVNASVVFLTYDSIGQKSEDSALWQQAMSIPQLTLINDDDGSIRRRFRARYSGETFLYDAAGELAFHGGITLSRGHAGANAGSATLVSLLQGQMSKRSSHPGYGCSLLTSSGSL